MTYPSPIVRHETIFTLALWARRNSAIEMAESADAEIALQRLEQTGKLLIIPLGDITLCN